MSTARKTFDSPEEEIAALRVMARRWNSNLGPAFALDDATRDAFQAAFGTKSRPTERVDAMAMLQALEIVVDIPEPSKRKGPDTLVTGNYAPGRPPDRLKAVANLTSFDKIKAEPAKWFWAGRFLLGALNLIEGDPGAGKSTFIGWLTSLTSRGGVWPDNGQPVERGSVVIIQQEEDKNGDLAPRLRAMRADLSRVHNFDSISRGDKTTLSLKLLGDFDGFESLVEQVPDLRLLIFDPVTSCFRGNETRSDTEIRDGLMPLLRLAQEKRFAIVGVIHFNKDLDKPLIYRAANSAAFIQIARMVWLISDDPRDRDRKLMTFVKGNPPTRVTTGLSMSLDKGLLKWDKKAVPFRAEAVDAALQKQRLQEGDAILAKKLGVQKAKASRWILSLLAKGERSQKSIRVLAEEAGFPNGTVLRAIANLTDDSEGEPRVIRFQKDNAQGKPVWLRLRPKPGTAIVHIADLARWTWVPLPVA